MFKEYGISTLKWSEIPPPQKKQVPNSGNWVPHSGNRVPRSENRVYYLRELEGIFFEFLTDWGQKWQFCQHGEAYNMT